MNILHFTFYYFRVNTDIDELNEDNEKLITRSQSMYDRNPSLAPSSSAKKGKK